MILYNGFVTGLVVGVLAGIAGMCVYALIRASRDEEKTGD